MPLEPKQEPPYYEITDGPAPARTLYYIALLTQSGTDAPTAIIQRNTLSAPIVWTRSNTGYYIGTLTGAFTANKTVVNIGQNNENGDSITLFYVDEPDTVEISTLTFPAGTYADTLLENTPISITIYP